MPNIDRAIRDLLRLTLVDGLGPVLIARLLAAMGSASAVIEAPGAVLKNVEGIGSERARRIRDALPLTDRLADEEIARADSLGVSLVGAISPSYPPLLRQVPDAPPLLYCKGELRPADADRYPVAIVGSRTCTAYGVEQAERFATHMAQAGLTIVSGGAKGIDTAAHRAALRVKGRTIAVLGCGLGQCYPPDNKELFDRIAAEGGCVVSELPLDSSPRAENFPARNRIISGLSLGVLVIEAGRRSGALITARLAAEEHGREVFALPARVDSTASEGSLDLIKKGGAALVTHPRDIIDALESPARHHFDGTHEAVTADPTRETAPLLEFAAAVGAAGGLPAASTQRQGKDHLGLSESQRSILGALDEPRTLDELTRVTGVEPGRLRAELTVLEVARRVRRQGTRIAAIR